MRDQLIYDIERLLTQYQKKSTDIINCRLEFTPNQKTEIFNFEKKSFFEIIFETRK